MRPLLRTLGYLLIISSFFRVIPIIAALAYGEPFGLFVLSLDLSLALGGILIYKFRKKEKEPAMNFSQGLILAASSFIILPLLGAISFLPSFDYKFLDAFFEAVSGFTTTGLTLYTSLAELPKSLLLWRAETQWLGGIGIIMVFLFIFSGLKNLRGDFVAIDEKAESASAIYQSQGFSTQMEGGIHKTMKNILKTYFGFTALGIALLLLTGFSFIDAIGMSFTALSTGGFSMSDQFHNGPWSLLVLELLMILGSISFITHGLLIERQWKRFLAAFEKNVFFVFVLLATAVSLIALFDLKIVFFEIISAFSTTGYTIAPVERFPQLFIMMIMAGMVIGGGFASTSGGIKVYRIYTLLRAIPWSIKKMMSPAEAVIPLKIDGKLVEVERVVSIAIFIFCYGAILLVGTTLFMIFGHSFFDSAFQMFSALGTVGLQTMPLAPLNFALKIVLMLAMLLGRLEIFPLLIALNMLKKSLFR